MCMLSRALLACAAIAPAADDDVVLAAVEFSEPGEEHLAALLRSLGEAEREAAPKLAEVEEQIKKLETGLSAAKEGKIRSGLKSREILTKAGRWTFKTETAKRERIQQIELVLRAKREQQESLSRAGGLREIANKVGSIGVFLKPVSVVQVIDKQQFIGLASMGQDDFVTVWVSGFSTKDLANDMQVLVPTVVYIPGTKTYDSLKGKNTVIVCRPVDAAKLAKKIRGE